MPGAGAACGAGGSPGDRPGGGELARVAGEPGRAADHLGRRRGRLALAGLLEHPGDLGDVDDVELQRAGAGGVDRGRGRRCGPGRAAGRPCASGSRAAGCPAAGWRRSRRPGRPRRPSRSAWRRRAARTPPARPGSRPGRSTGRRAGLRGWVLTSCPRGRSSPAASPRARRRAARSARRAPSRARGRPRRAGRGPPSGSRRSARRSGRPGPAAARGCLVGGEQLGRALRRACRASAARRCSRTRPRPGAARRPDRANCSPAKKFSAHVLHHPLDPRLVLRASAPGPGRCRTRGPGRSPASPAVNVGFDRVRVGDHRGQVVRDQHPEHAAEVPPRRLAPVDHRGEGLGERQPDEHVPRVDRGEDQRVRDPPPPGRPGPGPDPMPAEVELALHARLTVGDPHRGLAAAEPAPLDANRCNVRYGTTTPRRASLPWMLVNCRSRLDPVTDLLLLGQQRLPRRAVPRSPGRAHRGDHRADQLVGQLVLAALADQPGGLRCLHIPAGGLAVHTRPLRGRAQPATSPASSAALPGSRSPPPPGTPPATPTSIDMDEIASSRPAAPQRTTRRWSHDWQFRWSHDRGKTRLKPVPCSWRATLARDAGHAQLRYKLFEVVVSVLVDDRTSFRLQFLDRLVHQP